MNDTLRGVGRLCWWVLRIGLLLAGAGLVFAFSLWSTVERHFTASKTVVPDVHGMSETEAADRLAREGLGFDVDGREPSETVEPGLVLFQDPAPGSSSRMGRDVKVIVCAGPHESVAPKLVGRTRREGLIELRNAELAVGDVVQVHSWRPADEILAQSPQAGSAIEPSGRIGLLVSLGPRRSAFVMPEVRGRRLTEVERLLAEVDMRVSEVREQFVPGQPEGTVQSQSPDAGSRIARETSVRLVVSRASPLPTSVAPPSSGIREE